MLTVEQRLAVYEDTLKTFKHLGHHEWNAHWGLCKIFNFIIKDKYKIECLLEFVSQCPEGKTMGKFWFPFSYVGYCERIKILENCIEQCKNKINESKKSNGDSDSLVDRNNGSCPGE